jgi:hypothetical protein
MQLQVMQQLLMNAGSTSNDQQSVNNTQRIAPAAVAAGSQSLLVA